MMAAGGGGPADVQSCRDASIGVEFYYYFSFEILFFYFRFASKFGVCGHEDSDICIYVMLLIRVWDSLITIDRLI